MSEAHNPPIIAEADSIALDGVITAIREQLATLPWLHYSLGRVKPQKQDGKLEPWVQRMNVFGLPTEEYYPAYPNDELVSFSCVYAHDDERYQHNVFVTRTLSVIVWANLETIGVGTWAVEQLKRDVRRALAELDCVSEIVRSYDQTTTGASGVYPGFDVSGMEERYLTHPYGGFRLELIVDYVDPCY